jgi:hypothetical protein
VARREARGRDRRGPLAVEDDRWPREGTGAMEMVRQRQVSVTGVSEGRLGAGTPSGMVGGRWSAREQEFGSTGCVEEVTLSWIRI